MEIDLSSLGAFSTAMAAMFSKLGVPIKTAVPPMVQYSYSKLPNTMCECDKIGALLRFVQKVLTLWGAAYRFERGIKRVGRAKQDCHAFQSQYLFHWLSPAPCQAMLASSANRTNVLLQFRCPKITSVARTYCGFPAARQQYSGSK